MATMAVSGGAGTGVRVNPDLQKEREGATFDPTELTFMLDRGAEKTRRRRYIQSLALEDPDFDEVDHSFLTRDELYSSIMKRSVLIRKKMKELNLTDLGDQLIYKGSALRGEGSIFAIHDLMLIPMLQTQANDQQRKKWLPMALNYDIIGTYLQTELGHGTYVRGLETTATYDPVREEFVINSPTLTSTKWWPGFLGKSVNFGVVMAQLHSKGKKYGIHSFLVPLRSFDSHQPLPGITLGDIGPKLGSNGNDNGFCRFDHVRIPRENMLSKYAKIDRDGTYSPPISDKIVYGAMVLTRVTLVSMSAGSLSAGCTIAIRYSAVRRQSEQTPGGKEPQILDYQSQQLKLFPQLATALALKFAAHNIRNRCDQIQSDLRAGNVSTLQELHGLSSGMKAFSSLVANSGLEILRMSCGGHGYSQASGFPKLYGTATVSVTAEGEYTVMILQCARYLMKCVSKAAAGEKLPTSIAYLAEQPELTCPAKSAEDFLDLDLLCNAFKHRAYRLVTEAGKQMQSRVMAGKPQHIAWNESHLYLVKAAEAHCHYYTVRNFVNTMKSAVMSDSLKSVLTSLCQLYALYGIDQNSGHFAQDGYMTGQQLSMATDQIVSLLAVIRPNAVPLADAFDFRDELLCSVLGRYDGNVYENMYKWATESPLNKTEVHDSYKYLKPMLHSKM